MISKRRTAQIVNKVGKIIFKENQPKVEIRFVKNTQKRILKTGFRKLVPNSTKREVVLHIRHHWRRYGTERQLAEVVAHELLHAKQILRFELHQDKRGFIYYGGEQYWFRWNVFNRTWQVCKRGQFKSMWKVPWETQVREAQKYVADLAVA